MNPQPKQLALLISLIGIGVSPSAWARSELRAVGATPPAQGLTLDDNLSVSHAESAEAVDETWVPRGSTLDLPGTSVGWLLYAAPGEDWAPGELPGTPDWRSERIPHEGAVEPFASPVAQSMNPASEVQDLPRQTKRKHSGKSHRVRMLVPALDPMPARVEVVATNEGLAIERVARVQGVPAAATPTPMHAERLLESLAAVLREAPASETGVELGPVPLVEGKAPAEPEVVRVRQASAARLVCPEIAVATESSRVLNILSAILSDERDEVGAIKTDLAPTIVRTQSDKVMAMLSEISFAQQPQEDGPARRARKLAAAAARAEGGVRATSDAVAEAAGSGTTSTDSGVDVMLPLELPMPSLPSAADRVSPSVMEPPAMPMVAAQVVEPSARSNPFGGRQLAMSATSLDAVRGGFSGNGVNISFGIERAVYVNGALVATTSLNVSDLGKITAGRGTTSFDAGTIALVQSGAGNLVTPGAISSAAIGTVVQNTLDGQKIQNVTVINATVNSLSVLRSLNFQSSLRGAVIDSLRR